MKKKYKYLRVSIVFFTFICLFLYFKLEKIRDLVNIIIISCVISYILKPVRNKLKEKLNINNKKATIIIFIFTLVFFLCILFIVIPIMYNEFDNVSIVFYKLASELNSLEKKAFFEKSSIIAHLYKKIKERLVYAIESLSINVFQNIIKFSSNFLSYTIVPVISYYILADSTNLSQKALMIVPRKNRILFKKILYDIDNILGKYILGQMTLSGIITILSLIGMAVLKIKFPVWLSIINGIFNIIPYFGPIFGAVPIIFVALIDSTTKGIYAFLLLFLIQQIEGDIICPKITGNCTDIHPILILISIIVGEKLGGLFWMVMAVPIVVIFKVFYDDINKYLF